MITSQHSLILWWVLLEKYGVKRKKLALEEFKIEIPWLLLPDALREIFGPRAITHFQETPDGKDFSWIEFPNQEVLKTLSKKNKDSVNYHSNGPKKAAVGEISRIDEADKLNRKHLHYKFIRSHLLQDKILYNILVEDLILCDGKYENDGKGRYVCRHDNNIVIDGDKLRKQTLLFEELGFIYICGKLYENFGVEITREWFDENVYEPLKETYSPKLAESTYQNMRISDEVNERLKKHEFELTSSEIKSVYITDNFIEVLDKLYKDSIEATKNEV